MEEKKLSFFKKIRKSIFDFDSYQGLAAESISKTIVYIVLLTLIFGSIISLSYTIKFLQIINEAKTYIENEISEIIYEDYKLSVKFNNGENISKIDANNLLASKVIINTQDLEENQIDEYINEIKSEKNGILILNDKIIVKTVFLSNTMEYSYETISQTYNINNISKTEIINILNSNEMKVFAVTFFITILIYMFVIYISNILIDVLLLAILAYIVTKLARLSLKYSAIYNIAAYSLTLPIFLNIIYIVANIFTGFNIKYFQIMYTAIASIYIIAAILLIKSDIIKKQIELNKIVEEQDKIRQELKQKEEERKEKEEQERREKEREKQKKKKEEQDKSKEGPIKEPEGNNA